MSYVYILELENRQWYYGSTEDLQKRLSDHKRGSVASTRGQNPKLLTYRKFPSTKEAREFERYLKKSKNKSYIAKLMGL